MPNSLPTYRSLQELLLEKWDSYRALLEDPTVYLINPDTFLKPNQTGIDAIYHALSHVDSIRECNDILTDMMYILQLLLQRFEHTLEDEAIVLGHLTPMQIVDHLGTFASSIAKPASTIIPPRSQPNSSSFGPDGMKAIKLDEKGGLGGPQKTLSPQNQQRALLQVNPIAAPPALAAQQPVKARISPLNENEKQQKRSTTPPPPNVVHDLTTSKSSNLVSPSSVQMPILLNKQQPTLKPTKQQQEKDGKSTTALKFKFDLPKLEINDAPSTDTLVPVIPLKIQPAKALMTYDMEMNDVLTERMQHDLVSLTISIFSGLLHHADLIPKLPFAGSYSAETDKRILVGLLSDVVFLLFHFFELLSKNKKRFLLVINQLIKSNIIFASIHCCVNIVTQVITSKSMSFLYYLIKNDDNMTMLMIQSYDLLSILYLRLKLMVNIELLRTIQERNLNTPLNNSSELALRLKPLQDPLKECHLAPFLTLLQFYYQLFDSITALHGEHYIDDEYIFELESQVLFLIRFIQLLASQIRSLVADPTLDCSVPTGLTVVANRSLYIQDSPLNIDPATVPLLNRSKKDPQPTSNNKKTDNTLHHSQSVPLSQQTTRYVIDTGKKKLTPIQHPGDFLLGTNASPLNLIVGNNANQAQINLAKYNKQTMVIMRPLLQLSVDLLRQISHLTTSHEEIPDIFLYRDNGIIAASIKLGVEYRLDNPLTSFSPGLIEASKEQQDRLNQLALEDKQPVVQENASVPPTNPAK